MKKSELITLWHQLRAAHDHAFMQEKWQRAANLAEQAAHICYPLGLEERADGAGVVR